MQIAVVHTPGSCRSCIVIFGLSATLRDFAKLGRLYLNDGRGRFHKATGSLPGEEDTLQVYGEHALPDLTRTLERLGYRIVAANFSLPIGRNTRDVIVNAEIDVVAYDGPILCFIEVKTRVSDDFALPQTNVDLRKRRQIARAARGYRRMMGLAAAPFRYDVVTVIAKPDDVNPRIELLKGFWTDEQLQKMKEKHKQHSKNKQVI